MNIVITDAGLGGLSILSHLLQRYSPDGVCLPFSLTYINAVPSNELGYNDMTSDAQRMETFERFLCRVDQKHAADLILVACNTLSALMPGVPFCQQHPEKVVGIIQQGASQLLIHMGHSKPQQVLVMATPTTAVRQSYQEVLCQLGLEASWIHHQGCEGLATAISNDFAGEQVLPRVRECLRLALMRMEAILERGWLYLGCTHYGYQEKIFRQALDEEGLTQWQVFNPNPWVFQQSVETAVIQPEQSLQQGEVKFVSRYRIPANEVDNLSKYLQELSPPVARALQNQVVDPHLF